MKIAIVGSRSITVNNLGDYLPENTTRHFQQEETLDTSIT